MLTTFDLEDYVYAALRAGASGFVLKDSPAEELIRAVHAVARGEAFEQALPKYYIEAVEEHDVDGPSPEDLERLFAARRFHHLVAEPGRTEARDLEQSG